MAHAIIQHVQNQPAGELIRGLSRAVNPLGGSSRHTPASGFGLAVGSWLWPAGKDQNHRFGLQAPIISVARGNRMKPFLQNLWNAFPDHHTYPTMKDLYTMLGGDPAKNINAPGFGPDGNTCASRLSVAFNKGGAPIRPFSVSTLKAADGSLIIFRVADFRSYLIFTLGKPKIDNTSPYDDAFKGKKGIIAFSVNWQGASGHIALWNGTTYREPAHDNYSTYVNATIPNIRTSRGEFWELS